MPGRKVRRGIQKEGPGRPAADSGDPFEDIIVPIKKRHLQVEGRDFRAREGLEQRLGRKAVDPVSLVRHEKVLATVGAVRMLEEKLA